MDFDGVGLRGGDARMTQPAKAQEPSMEEILASIRRIIADDDSAKAPPPRATDPVPPRPGAAAARVPPLPARPAQPPPSVARQNEVDAVFGDPDPPRAPAMEKPRSDVLDLTEDMAATAVSEAGAFQAADGESDFVFDSVAEEPPVAPAPPKPPRRTVSDVPEQKPEQRLMSSSTSAAVDSAFNSLAHTVLAQNARTLEDLVKEMLRPMLKSWLDENLPALVERMVRAEIDRVSRGRT
jgi:uncharacterized protein